MRARRTAVFLIIGATALFQIWFLGLGRKGKNFDDSRLSNLYTEALAHGQSYLLIEPDRHLIEASNPFASEFRQYILSDASLYNGHYYLYFGIVPFVTLLVPLYILTGTIISPGAAILFFCTVGYLAYAYILLMAWRRWFVRSSSIAFSASLICLIVSSSTWPLMGRPAIYEIENAAAFACLALALLSIQWCELKNAKSSLSIMAAGLFATLCLGCRPNYFPAVGVIGCWIVYRSWKQPRPMISRVLQLLANLTPLVVVAFSLGLWNFHRFNDPLEFGLKYTVSSDPAIVRPLATLSNIPYGVHRYALGAPRLIRYFPYIQGQKPGPFKLGPVQEPSNQVYGFLLISPILLCAGLLCTHIKDQSPNGIRAFSAVAFLTSLGNFAFLGSVTMSCYRYPADFLGPLCLLSSLGLLGLSSSISRLPRFVAPVLTIPLLLWSTCAAVFQLFSTAQTTSLFDMKRPEDFAAAGRPFNHVSYFFEQLRHDGPRAISIEVKLPHDRFGHVEPLVVTGENGSQDFLYLYYIQDGMIQLGFESTGYGGLLSHYKAVDYSKPHRFELHYGSFLPPDDHPLLRSFSRDDLALARRSITILLDGEIIMDGWAKFHLPRGNFSIGTSPDDAAFGSAFSGKILQVKWPLIPAKASPLRWEKSSYGSMIIDMELQPMPPGVFDPLVSFGEPNQGAQILIEHLLNSMVRVVWLDSHKQKFSSEPFVWPNAQTRKVELSVGSLLPPIASSLWSGTTPIEQRTLIKKRLKVQVDDTVVFEVHCDSPDVSPTTVVVGKDTLFLTSSVMPVLAGPVHSIKRGIWPSF